MSNSNFPVPVLRQASSAIASLHIAQWAMPWASPPSPRLSPHPPDLPRLAVAPEI